jgi:hypothetical protein
VNANVKDSAESLMEKGKADAPAVISRVRAMMLNPGKQRVAEGRVGDSAEK